MLLALGPCYASSLHRILLGNVVGKREQAKWFLCMCISSCVIIECKTPDRRLNRYIILYGISSGCNE